MLQERKHAVTRHETWLELPDSGFALLPLYDGFDVMQNGGLHTVTTIQIHHPTLVPGGVFEYQHSWGDTVASAMRKGFDQWYQVDFVAFLDALKRAPTACMAMEMTFPGSDGNPAYSRRAILGPVANYRANPLPPKPDGSVEEHPFCPCCFFTNTAMAFKELVQDKGFVALRFYAARNADGTPDADCRVNGDDRPAGMDALKEYVKTWPGTGFEFRKQYVLLHLLEKPVASQNS